MIYRNLGDLKETIRISKVSAGGFIRSKTFWAQKCSQKDRVAISPRSGKSRPCTYDRTEIPNCT